ncbi:MAG: hypothetical protein FJ138_13135 [Deltaproteobacteria bacterium]|nr:hypothetical protein [Deltaproteobacteria bacterium]
MNIKNLLAYLLTLVVSVSLTACPDDCGTEEGGTEGGATGGATGGDCGGAEGGNVSGGANGGSVGGAEGGSVGGSTPEAPVYSVIVIVDQTSDVNDDGTPGVDICEVDIVCGEGVRARLDEDNSGIGSNICDGSNGENCVCQDIVIEPTCTSEIDRSNFRIADNDEGCDASERGKVSAYVSLGIGGYIAFDLDGADANGCQVTVEEKQGSDEESYSVLACPADFNGNADNCVLIDSATNAARATFTIDTAN